MEIKYTKTGGQTSTAWLTGRVTDSDRYVAIDRHAEAPVVVEQVDGGWQQAPDFVNAWLASAASMRGDGLELPDRPAPRELVIEPLPPEYEVNEMATVAGPFWGEEKTVEALGLASRDVLTAMRQANEILGLTDDDNDDGPVVYPVVQFQQRGDVVEVRPGMAPFFQALHAEAPWTIAILLRTPAPELDGLTPARWIRDHRDVETLVDYGRRLAHKWAH